MQSKGMSYGSSVSVQKLLKSSIKYIKQCFGASQIRSVPVMNIKRLRLGRLKRMRLRLRCFLKKAP